MKKNTSGILLQIPLWIIMLLVVIGPILPDDAGTTHPVLFMFLLVIVGLHIWGITKMVKSPGESVPKGKKKPADGAKQY